MWGNHLFEVFRAGNAEKVIPPHLGSFPGRLGPVWGNHLLGCRYRVYKRLRMALKLFAKIPQRVIESIEYSNGCAR